MKKTFCGMLLTIGGLLCVMGFAPDSAPPDLSSPKEAVRSFVIALGKHDIKAMAQCVQGATDAAGLEKLLNEDLASFPTSEVKTLIVETDGAASHVAVEILFKPRNENIKESITLVEMFTLRKEGDSWRIVPDADTLKQVAEKGEEDGSALGGLRPLTTLVATMAAPKPALEVAQAKTCLANAKQIATGVMMYVQDYDEIFPPKKGAYSEAIQPYVKNRKIFTCPMDPKGTITYTFNANVLQAPLASIVDPSKTVMLYEGKNMKLDFRHDGKAVVAYLDGHAKLIGPEEAKSLFWYDGGAKPTPAPPAKKPATTPKKKKK